MTAEDGTNDRTLWCGNVADSVTEELLYELFLQAGPLEKVYIATDRDGHRRGYAFITFKHAVSVPYTVDLMDGISLNNRQLRLQLRTGSSHDLGRSPGLTVPAMSPQLHRSFSAPIAHEPYGISRMQNQARMCPPQFLSPMMQPMFNGSPPIGAQPRPLMPPQLGPPVPCLGIMHDQGQGGQGNVDQRRAPQHGNDSRDLWDRRDRSRDRSPRSRDVDRSPHSRHERPRDMDMRHRRDSDRDSDSDYRRKRPQETELRRGPSHYERRSDRSGQGGGHHDSWRRGRDSHSYNRRDGQRR